VSDPVNDNMLKGWQGSKWWDGRRRTPEVRGLNKFENDGSNVREGKLEKIWVRSSVIRSLDLDLSKLRQVERIRDGVEIETSADYFFWSEEG